MAVPVSDRVVTNSSSHQQQRKRYMRLQWITVASLFNATMPGPVSMR